ncbi:MAG: hypothetical protein COW44_09695 [Flavobacteriaceae bacterium CG17_big_fil_post_rev_8_21_14_2_50_33_15]|nr:MAG: hypothetical protein COW44_09695 [Flavobacteriaceae bacterium CG17_big_fil_post_rev_8_21_14_2_50_33_15]PJB19083.1 MAG: hypothetical protein CO117_05795 [Flavobacteriaceae bacterium CG_4_9_14_3_um_filter_33_16]
MKLRIAFFFLLLNVICSNSFAQECNCASQLNFAIHKIETNYAGFTDKVTDENRMMYEDYTKNFIIKASQEKNADNCLNLVKQWMEFFKDGHLQIRTKANSVNTVSSKITSDDNKTYFKKINAETNLIRIGSFNHVYKKMIDSVIRANYAAITSTKYLLIDLRGNHGGSDVSYKELIPFIYTNPIEVIGMSKLSTPDNIEKYNIAANDDIYSADSREYARKIAEKLKAIPGQFLEGETETVSLKEILPYPALVGIVVNNKCGSTTEQFLLAAKQSKKTVFFGENSAGILDYANMHFLDFPCYNWRLGYATSRSMRLPKTPVDNIGISPDIYLTGDNPDWVSYAAKYISKMPSIGLDNFSYTDTLQVDLKMMAKMIAGNSTNTYDKVRNVVWWTNKNFSWNFTDYKKRTPKQIICQKGGNCNEQAQVVRALLTELNVKTRRTSEINIQLESERRQKDAERQIGLVGNRASVFGYRHNDHVWVEFYDEQEQEWVPADATIGKIGLDSWLKARIGFEPRVNHAVILSAEMLVPISVFARNPDGTIAENRSTYYLVESFNKVYKNKLANLPAWKRWVEGIEFIQLKSKNAFEGKENLHLYTDKIKELKEIYEDLKAQYNEIK